MRCAVWVTGAMLLVACAGQGASNPSLTPISTAAFQATTTVADTLAVPSTSPPSAPATTPFSESSNCSPGAGPLPDGVWFGYVESANEGEIQFDLACWFSGQAAVEAAAEDGAESPPPNDYYVRNQNSYRRDVSLGDDLMVTWYRSGDPQKEEYTDYAAWLADRAIDDAGRLSYPFGIWITVDGGKVTELSEQWVP